MNRAYRWLVNRGIIKLHAYKVVRYRRGRLQSAIAGDLALIIYHVCAWVRANPRFAKAGYHILCFDSLKAAQDFSSCAFHDQVWLCEVKGRVPKIPPMLYLRNVEGGCLEGQVLKPWPPGTIMVEEIMLVERVD